MKFSPLTHPDNPKSKDQFELDDDIDEQVRHYRFVPGVDEMSFRKIQRKLNRQRKASLHVWGKVDDIKKEMMERKKEKILLRKSQQSEADKKIKEEIDEGYEEEDYAKSEEEMRESPLSDVGFGGEEEEEQWGFFDEDDAEGSEGREKSPDNYGSDDRPSDQSGDMFDSEFHPKRQAVGHEDADSQEEKEYDGPRSDMGTYSTGQGPTGSQDTGDSRLKKRGSRSSDQDSEAKDLGDESADSGAKLDITPPTPGEIMLEYPQIYQFEKELTEDRFYSVKTRDQRVRMTSVPLDLADHDLEQKVRESSLMRKRRLAFMDIFMPHCNVDIRISASREEKDLRVDPEGTLCSAGDAELEDVVPVTAEDVFIADKTLKMETRGKLKSVGNSFVVNRLGQVTGIDVRKKNRLSVFRWPFRIDVTRVHVYNMMTLKHQDVREVELEFYDVDALREEKLKMMDGKPSKFMDLCFAFTSNIRSFCEVISEDGI
ncbi:RNA 5'-triphosphatase Cet1/Ctl1 like protein [Aduncisulcus paluster]|uniref:mRNA 5'-phosphatase n=1 Tax=Aduncisulcus paluster TaxID=2918883 RepID=A0ABQ5KY03_9EUKA|nr:RNA 5'-triphosphatase Cet1/Ctl1 like protein [Aduncisulcus paluster]